MTRKAISSEQGRSSAVAFHFHPVGGREAGGLPGLCLAETRAIVAGVRSPPLRGGTIQARMALPGGRPGDDAKGGFLGGARSPRPDCNALLMPRHFITLGGWPGGRGLMETCLGQAGALLRACGARPSAGVDHPT
jgi:hypothetical protein